MANAIWLAIFGAAFLIASVAWGKVHVRDEGPRMERAGRSRTGDSLSFAYAILFGCFGAAFLAASITF